MSRLSVVMVALALALTACGGLDGQAPTSTVRSTSTVAAGASSRPAVGLSIFRFVDRSRRAVFRNGTSSPRTLVTYVRYPRSGHAPFPLIVFCHGFALLPSAYTRLLDAWARAGYVVAAPVFPVENERAPGGPDESDLVNQPGDVSFVISQLLRMSRLQHSHVHGLIDPSRIAVAGHSDGGETAFAVAFESHYLDRRVRLGMVLSGATLPPAELAPRPGGPPLLATQGSADHVNAPTVTRQLFSEAPRPKYLLILLHSGHLGPYTRDLPQLAVVERVTIAFLDHYFKHAPLRRLLAAGHAPGRARLVSRP